MGKNTMTNIPWLWWALLEGLAQASALTTYKIAGLGFSAGFKQYVFIVLILGIVQSGGALIISLIRGNRRFLLHPKFVLWSCLFGVSAVVQTLIVLFAFSLEAPMGVYVFIVVGLSLVPAALFDRYFFGTKLTRQGWTGVMLALVGGYAMLGFPSVGEIASLPTWLPLALFAMLLFAVNQALVRAASKVKVVVDDMSRAIVQNVWIGLVTVILCVPVLFVDPAVVTSLPDSFVFAGVFAGGFIVLVLVARMMAFRQGSGIALRKTVATGTFLLLSALAGWGVGDPFGLPQLLGIALYPLAIILVQRGTTGEQRE